MRKARVTTEGVTSTEQYLTVHVTIGETGAKRFEEVKVPMARLVRDPQFLDCLARATARDLKQAWDLDEPMVLVGCGQPPWVHCNESCNGCENSCTHEGCIHAA